MNFNMFIRIIYRCLFSGRKSSQYLFYYYNYTQKQKKVICIVQIAYTSDFGKVRNLNDIVRESP